MKLLPRLFVLALTAFSPCLAAAAEKSWTPPKGFSVPESTISPDGAYGVTAPDWKHFQEGKSQNTLVNLRTGRTLALLDTNLFTWVQDDSGGMNHTSLETCWSADGSVFGWVLGGKWSPSAITLVKVRDGAVAWQLDVEAAVQKAILERTRKAAPANYAAAVKQNAGSGRAFPEGFTVDMDVPQAGFSLPWKGHATLDSNPKSIADGWPAKANVAASLDFTANPDGTIVFSNFALDRSQTGVPRAEP
jgi:hypothetical protein